MENTGIFQKWLDLVQDRSNIWNYTSYHGLEETGTAFGAPATIKYVYVLGSSYVDLVVHPNPDVEGSVGGRFYIYLKDNHGVQIYHKPGIEEYTTIELLPTYLPDYNYKDIPSIIENLLRG